MRTQLSLRQRIGIAVRAVGEALSTELRFPMQGFSGFLGDWAWLRRLLPGSRFDFYAAAGDLWLNSIVCACFNWQARVFSEAPLVVFRKDQGDDSQEEQEIIADHPLTKLVKRPNRFYSGSVLWFATLLSLMVDGNAFWFIERSDAGKPIGLWWMPHWMIQPMFDSDGSTYLTTYRYVVNGQYYVYAESDIVHFRHGLDPRNQRRGLSPLAAEIRHICTDNEAASYQAAIVRNMGVPGVIIKPPVRRAPDEPQLTIAKVTRDLIKETWREKFATDKAGEPLVFDTPLEIAPTGFSPKELAIDGLRGLPEERICAAIGIPAVVVGMGSGLAKATAKASHENSERQAYYSNIIPTQRLVSEELDLQLLPDLGDPDKEFVGFDLRRVRFLQVDFAGLVNAVVEAFQGGVLKRNEARRRLGEKPDDDMDLYIEQIPGAQKPGLTVTQPNPAKKPAGADKTEEED